MNDISVVIVVVEDVLTWIDKYLELSCNTNLKSNEENIFLLIQYHAYVFKLKPLEYISLKWYSVQLILGPRLVIMSPYVFLLKNLYHLNLFLHELLVVVTLSKNVSVLSEFCRYWFTRLFEMVTSFVFHDL